MTLHCTENLQSDVKSEVRTWAANQLAITTANNDDDDEDYDSNNNNNKGNPSGVSLLIVANCPERSSEDSAKLILSPNRADKPLRRDGGALG